MPMTSEPTTGEIAEFLSRLSHMMLYQLNDARASEMIDFTARRLRELEEGKKEALGYLGCATEKEDKYKNTIAALTARAEQAEKNLHDAIFGTNHACFYCTMEDCDGCTNSTIKEHFKYRALKPNKYLTIQEERGLPQDGEGV